MGNTILEMKGVTKTFPGVKALDRVNFKLQKGEIHALIGENGAGKSTLMHVLAGIHTPDEGTIKLKGQETKLKSPYDATRKGIGVVFQELSLVDNLSIAENIFVNRQPVKTNGLINTKALYRETRELLSLFEMNCPPDLQVSKLSTGDQQLVEILKALSQDPDILILDEPTSSLSKEESKKLFNILNDLKNKGIQIIYISHRLNEIFELCDQVTVLRDGQYVGTKSVQNTNEDELVKMMVGRDIKDIYGQQRIAPKGEYFRVKNFNSPGKLKDVSLKLREGEILGIFGLVGAGRTELGQAIFGLDPEVTGELNLEGHKLEINSPGDAINHGLAYMTEDRKSSGLFLDFTVKENLVSANLQNFIGGFLDFLNDRQIKKYAEDLVEKYNIVTPSLKSLVSKLSGGNQQKTLLANWMGIDPRVLIVDEPTRGVDVGAKSDIYNYLRDLVFSKEIGVILLSSDLPEVIGVSDRILVMREGEIVDEFLPEEATEENVLASAAGVTHHIC